MARSADRTRSRTAAAAAASSSAPVSAVSPSQPPQASSTAVTPSPAAAAAAIRTGATSDMCPSSPKIEFLFFFFLLLSFSLLRNQKLTPARKHVSPRSSIVTLDRNSRLINNGSQHNASVVRFCLFPHICFVSYGRGGLCSLPHLQVVIGTKPRGRESQVSG